MLVRFDNSAATAHVTPDGLQWLDPDGNQPHIDKEGRLIDPFILATYAPDGITTRRKERFMPPARLPLTPAAYKSQTRPTGSDIRAESGNSEGDEVAIAEPKSLTQPAPKPSAKKASTRDKAIAKATAPIRPSTVKAKAAPKPEGGPSKPANGMVHIRHMRNPHDAFILIKNPGVFGTESNWATKEEFKTAEAAMEWAKKNGLKVVNPK